MDIHAVRVLESVVRMLQSLVQKEKQRLGLNNRSYSSRPIFRGNLQRDDNLSSSRCASFTAGGVDECSYCGKNGHLRAQCYRYLNACFGCGSVGHFIASCTGSERKQQGIFDNDLDSCVSSPTGERLGSCYQTDPTLGSVVRNNVQPDGGPSISANVNTEQKFKSPLTFVSKSSGSAVNHSLKPVSSLAFDSTQGSVASSESTIPEPVKVIKSKKTISVVKPTVTTSVVDELSLPGIIGWVIPSSTSSCVSSYISEDVVDSIKANDNSVVPVPGEDLLLKAPKREPLQSSCSPSVRRKVRTSAGFESNFAEAIMLRNETLGDYAVRLEDMFGEVYPGTDFERSEILRDTFLDTIPERYQ